MATEIIGKTTDRPETRDLRPETKNITGPGHSLESNINPIELKNRLIKKQEYLNFIERGGYAKGLTDFNLDEIKTQVNQAIRDLDAIIADFSDEPEELI